jgi:LPS-assembly lipoprotein
MSWPNRFPFRLTAAALLAAAVGGCFQPLYGDRSLTGGPSVRDAMREVEVAAIDGRVGQEVRNDLIFELTGGEGNPVGAPYRILMSVSAYTFYPVIDLTAGRPSAETVALDVSYRVEDVANKKTVLAERALARVTIDRSQQRFARVRAIRDAENRAAKVAAEQIRSRIAAFFLTRS